MYNGYNSHYACGHFFLHRPKYEMLKMFLIIPKPTQDDTRHHTKKKRNSLSGSFLQRSEQGENDNAKEVSDCACWSAA